MAKDLKIIYYPDPRLRVNCEIVRVFDADLRDIAATMIQLMHEYRGVGLAAPQVGLNFRMFVMNPTGGTGEDRVYVNPMLSDADGEEEGEEGCLSIPNVNAKIWRSTSLKMTAQDLEGTTFEEVASGFVPRIWQHETDHLNGTLITDRMGPLAKLGARRALRELQEKWEAAHPTVVKKRRS